MKYQMKKFLSPSGILYRIKLQLLRLLVWLHIGQPKALKENPIKLMGLTFPNRCGIACGIDKHGDYLDALALTGAGYIAIGPITPRATKTKRQYFLAYQYPRGPQHHSFISKGLSYLRNKLNKSHFRGILALVLSKQPETSFDNAIDDFRVCMQEVYPYANFLVFDLTWLSQINLSKAAMHTWLSDLLLQLKVEQGIQITEYHRYVPLMIKILPDLPPEQLTLMAELITQIQLEGIVLADSHERSFETHLTHQTILQLRRLLPPHATIIAESGL